MYTQPKTCIPSCLLALLTLVLPIHGATDDVVMTPREQQKLAFNVLMYKGGGAIPAFLIAQHVEKGYYQAKDGNAHKALGTTEAERRMGQTFWQRCYINVDRIKTQHLCSYVQCVDSASLPLAEASNADGHIATPKERRWYTDAQSIMHYLIGWYTPQDGLMKRYWKRRLGLQSKTYRTIDEAIQAGIDPEDYVLLLKTMQAYFTNLPTKKACKEQRLMQSSMQKLYHPYFNNLVNQQDDPTSEPSTLLPLSREGKACEKSLDSVKIQAQHLREADATATAQGEHKLDIKVDTPSEEGENTLQHSLLDRHEERASTSHGSCATTCIVVTCCVVWTALVAIGSVSCRTCLSSYAQAGVGML